MRVERGPLRRYGPGDAVLAVDSHGMSMTANGERQTATVTTLRAAAEFAGAVRLGDVNYGGSPGDAHIDEPYLYVGTSTRPRGEFWNTSFGAARRRGELRTADDGASFFDTGAIFSPHTHTT